MPPAEANALPSRRSRRIPRTVPALVALVLTALALTALVLVPEPGLQQGYDWVRMHVFYKAYFRESLLSGSLPLWNPYSALGRPFLADIETATFYPPNLLYLAGTGLGLTTNLALHFLLALSGMIALGRRLGCRDRVAWFGALGFALSAPVLGRLQSGQLQVFCALCWLPVVLATALALRERPAARPAVRLAVTLALTFLAGSPPMFWLAAWATATVLVLGLLSPGNAPPIRPTLGWLAVAGGLAAALVAVQALPFAELVYHGNRNALPTDYALAYGMAGPSWWSLLHSRPPGAYYYWEYNLYAGLPLMLAAAAVPALWRSPSVRRWILLALIFAVLALGAATPVLPWLVQHLPGWDALRYPSRYAIVTLLACALLASCVLEQTCRILDARGHARAAGWLCGALLMLNAADCARAYFERAPVYARPADTTQEKILVERLRSTGLLGTGQPPPRVVAHPAIVRENSGLLHGYGTLSGFGNPFLGNVWTEIHTRLGLAPEAKDPVNLPPEAYHAPTETYAGLDIAARWDPASGRFEVDSARSGRARLDTTGRAAVTDFRPDHILVHTSAPVPHRLFLAEPWYPGWSAEVDSVARPVVSAGWMRAVDLPAGEHLVEFSYRSRWLPLGAALSLLALLTALALWRAGKPALQ